MYKIVYVSVAISGGISRIGTGNKGSSSNFKQWIKLYKEKVSEKARQQIIISSLVLLCLVYLEQERE